VSRVSGLLPHQVVDPEATPGQQVVLQAGRRQPTQVSSPSSLDAFHTGIHGKPGKVTAFEIGYFQAWKSPRKNN